MRMDTLAFLSPQGAPPEADPSLGEHIDAVHVTAVPPMMKHSKDILKGTERFPSLAQARHILESQSGLKVIESAQDLDDLEGTGKTGIIMGLQETPYDVSIDVLRQFYEHGVRVITPSYQEDGHPIGSGYTNPVKPLTNAGRQFLLDCAEVGLIVDLSHLGHQTARDVLEFRSQQDLKIPILASHGGVFELFDGDISHKNNLRNLPWDVLEQVTDADGLVGIYALTFGLSEEDDTCRPFLNQTVTAAERLGHSAVAIGTDAIYKERDLKEWRETTEWLASQLAKSGELEPRFPDIPLELNSVGKMALIEAGLQARGVAAEQTQAIIGENALKFFKKNL